MSSAPNPETGNIVSMNRLVIEYSLQGHQRGYNFTTSTRSFDEQTLRTIWRNAMPRGQGWGEATYQGARSIKYFPLPDGRAAVSEVTVTDLQDENGRRGIRRAVIDIMSPAVFVHHLASRLDSYPQETTSLAETNYLHLRKSLPKLKRTKALILTHHYQTERSWWLVEALVLRLAATPPAPLRKWGSVLPFTTLALDHRDESPVVALPAACAGQISTPIIEVRADLT
jgi:hypothetical protein